jgi:TraM recognition site of TraD and TraG/CagE, TrbE, VirB family, component of type IV transporter system
VFKLSQITKDYREAAPLSTHINLFGFLDEEIFLTKSGDLGIVLGIPGVDYECLDSNTIENLTRRLTASFRIFDEKCRVYQYLFKRNKESIPFTTSQNPVVNAAILNRIAYLGAKSDSLYSFEIYYVVLYEAFRYKSSILGTLAKALSEPRQTLDELAAHFTTRKQIVLIKSELEQASAMLRAKAQSFLLQVGDFVSARVLGKQEAFRVFKQILNFSPLKLENARLKHDTFLDYYLAESHLECHRGFLRVDDYYLKVLTLKEPSAQSFPLIFRRLFEVQANYYICSEWKKQSPAQSRSLIHSRRRHFHNTKRSLASYAASSDDSQRHEDVLVDESKEAQVRDLGEALKELEIKGDYFGTYSLTIVVYDTDLAKVDEACAEFYKTFTVHDAQLYEEKYNLFNAYLATVPGNYAFNLRSMIILNTNYADYSFLFTLHCGDRVNAHLKKEYLAVLETNHRTPYYLNLHCQDTAHSVILGRTGSGKFFSLSRQAKCVPLVATQSVSSLKSTLPGETWRTLLQTFRTKIFLSLSDDFSARIASDLCGHEEKWRVNYNISESGHDSRVSYLTGKPLADKAHISTSKTYSQQRDYRFDMKTFTELKNAQSVTLAYDGLDPLPPMFCYLKPYFNDVNKSYFRQLAEGQL